MGNVQFEELKGKTLKSINVVNCDEELEFVTDEETPETYKLYHESDCCESVLIEDITGDLDDLIGSPILLAEEVVHEQDENPEGVPEQKYQDSFTWTFYKLSTIKGSVTIRWYGQSNGYYSEAVNFIKD